METHYRSPWSGTLKPGWFRWVFTKFVFFLRHLTTWTQDPCCSLELTKLRRFFRVCKKIRPKSVDDVRVPFLAIVSPPSKHFSFEYCSLASAFAQCPVFTIGADCHTCERMVVYFHGGGFISGDLAGYSALCEKLVLKLGFNTCIIFPQYPLAPCANLGKIFDTGFKILAWTASFSKQYVVMGDSAGGGLSLSAVQKICQSSMFKPSSLVMFSPLCNIDREKLVFDNNDNFDVCLSSAVVRWSLQFGLNGGVVASQINPINGPFFHLCKTMILCSKDEVLHKDCVVLFDNCIKAGVMVRLVEHSSSIHACALYSKLCPEGEMEICLATDFILESLRT